MEDFSLLTRKRILDRRRTITNKPLLGLFLMLCIFWFPIVIYAYCSGNSSAVFPPNYINESRLFFNVSRIFIIIGYILLAGVYTVLYFIAMRRINNITMYVIICTLGFPIGAAIADVTYNLSFSTTYTVIGAVFSCILTIILLSTEWFHLPEKILKESCKAVIVFPAALVLSAISYLICVLVIAVTLTAHLYLMTLLSSYALALQFINIITGLWLMVIVFNSTQMVLCATFATWFWAENKEEVTNRTVLRCLGLITKYHIGTVAHASSIIGIFQTIYLMLKKMFAAFKEGCSLSLTCFILYNLFDPIVFKFTLFSATIRCATDGKSYGQAAEDTLQIFMRYPKRCLVVIKVTEYLLLFGIIIISLVMMLSLYGYIDYLPVPIAGDYNWRIIFALTIFCGSLLFILPLVASIVAASYTILICFLEDSEINDGSEQKPYVMSPELRSVMVHDGPPSWFRFIWTCGGTIGDANERNV